MGIIKEFVVVVWAKLCGTEHVIMFTIVNVLKNTGLGGVLDGRPVSKFLKHVGAPVEGLELGDEGRIVE
jgi:hypothetical protein